MTQKKEKQLALDWDCDERTIRRWRKAGAPLTDPQRMRSWLAGQKHLPAGTGAILKRMRSNETTQSAAQEQKLAEGPVAALRRLGEMEARAFTDLKRALATGDPLEIKLARENWLKISESQRRADIAIEQNRRDSGELVPREELLRLTHDLHRAIYEAFFAFQDIIPRLIGVSDPQKLWHILGGIKDDMHGFILQYFTRPRNPEHAIPKWMIKAVTFGEFPIQPAKVDERLDQMADFWIVMREEIAQRAAELRAEVDKSINTKPEGENPI